MIINAFKNKLFPLHSGNHYKKFEEESSEGEGEDEKPEDKTVDVVLLNKLLCWTNFMALI